LRGREVIAALRRAGFEVWRTEGSRHFMRHPDGRRTVVPVHAGETIGPGLLSKILKDAEMEADEFARCLRDKRRRWHHAYMGTAFHLEHRGQTAGQRAVMTEGGYAATRLGGAALSAQLYRQALARGLGKPGWCRSSPPAQSPLGWTDPNARASGALIG
jgi:predicted RNA binding protein YcfA (HicA-like mRNA interferase family)